jgi:hypothetical protein
MNRVVADEILDNGVILFNGGSNAFDFQRRPRPCPEERIMEADKRRALIFAANPNSEENRRRSQMQ